MGLSRAFKVFYEKRSLVLICQGELLGLVGTFNWQVFTCQGESLGLVSDQNVGKSSLVRVSRQHSTTQRCFSLGHQGCSVVCSVPMNAV